ncbi:flagellar hook-length control protein FliK [Paeniglutamicibacter sp. NPDC091659]|uniref:flagellar hook-length control protein FliK n=1 Tax=Paeniglutamicibacter sp. NPDC091659 TaxID=3364389 RepID=UPI003805249C
MIPLLVGVLPAQNTAQPTNAGSGGSGGSFENLLASMLPAEQDSAQALDETAIEQETKEKNPAGMVGEAFGELQFQERLATLGTVIPSIAPATPAPDGTASMAIGDTEAPAAVHPATPATVGAVEPGQPEMPPSPADALDTGTSAPAIPAAAVSGSDVATGSSAATGTTPGVVLLAGGAAPGTRTNAGGNGRQATEAVEEPATVSVEEAPAEAQEPAFGLEARPAGLAPESKPSQMASAPGFPVPVSLEAARNSRPETLLGVGAVSGGRTLAIENVVSREPQAPPINRQLLGPISALATGPHGERTLSVNIAPEALGPVTVKAHLGHEGLRVELTAPTEAGREALRAMLPELRRDLAATGAGTVSIGTATDAGTGAGTFSGGGQASMANDHRFGGGSSATAAPGKQQGEEATQLPANEAQPSAHASSHLDVMA